MVNPDQAAAGAAHLRTEVGDDGILSVVIDRPEKRNALSRAVLSELQATFTAFAADDTLKAAVLRGAGDKSFAAGGDLRDLAELKTYEEAVTMAEDAKAALDAVRRFPVPVIAALNGDAMGGGAELALACDLRVMAAGVRIGFVQGRLNISTAWGGGIDLMQLVGPAVGLRLLASSRMVDGPRAMELGLADRAAATGESLDDALAGLLDPIRRQVPQVMRAFKAVALAHRRGRPEAELREIETEYFAHAWVHRDHWEAADKLLAGKG